MTKINEADELKAYKAAKTPKEMVESWGLKLGGKADMLHELYGVYEEKAPHLNIIKTFVQDPEIEMMERGILDPKGKELAKLALALGSANTTRVTTQVVAAKAKGATDEEIMDAVWLSVYSAAKSPLSNIGQAIQRGWELAEELKTTEKLAAARKAGKEYIVDPEEETEAYRNAKTQRDIIGSWYIKLGLPVEQGLAEWDKGAGPGASFKAYDVHAGHLAIIKDLMHDPIVEWMDRRLEGHAVDWKTREYIWWAQCAQAECMGCLTAHVAYLLGRGATEEEIMELVYLTGVELIRAHMERVGPALAEGFRQAAELGL